MPASTPCSTRDDYEHGPKSWKAALQRDLIKAFPRNDAMMYAPNMHRHVDTCSLFWLDRGTQCGPHSLQRFETRFLKSMSWDMVCALDMENKGAARKAGKTQTSSSVPRLCAAALPSVRPLDEDECLAVAQPACSLHGSLFDSPVKPRTSGH